MDHETDEPQFVLRISFDGNTVHLGPFRLQNVMAARKREFALYDTSMRFRVEPFTDQQSVGVLEAAVQLGIGQDAFQRHVASLPPQKLA